MLIKSLKYKPKIIAITEFKNKCKQNVLIQEFNIPGYSLYCNDIYSSSRGVLIYVDSNLESSEISINSLFNEYVIVKIKGANGVYLTVCNVYRSPNSSCENDTNLSELINKLCCNTKGDILIVGDFNLGDINWGNYTAPNNNLSSQLFIKVLRDNLLTQLTDTPTRARGTDTPHILDLVIVNNPFVESVKHLAPLGKSDHVVLNIVCNFNVNVPVVKLKQHFSKGNYNDLRKTCSIDWSHILDPVNYSIEENWNIFKNHILESSKLYIPIVNDFGSWKKSKWKRPLNSDIRVKIKAKKCAWKKYIRSKNQSDYSKYKTLRDDVRNDTRLLDKTEQNNIAILSKSNPKKFWSYVNSKVKSHNQIGDLNYTKSVTNGQKVATTNEEKVDILNDYFSSVFIEESYEEVEEVAICGIPNMEKIVINEEIILKKLDNLNVNKSAGPDQIHPRVLYEVRKEIAFPLKLIFEQTIMDKKLPTDWRSGNISAIYKKGSKLEAGNYRPISLTCICCKLLESIIRDHIVQFFFSNNLFSKKQYGFIKGRSTVQQLLKVLDDWTEKLDNGGRIDVLYTDLEKAFDKVPHRRLLRKLKRYNLHPDLIDWIKAFLSDRKQRVHLNGVYSSWATVLSGIPQGSILGPLLFIIYINDLPDSLNADSNIFLYADDAKLYRYISTSQDISSLQDDINKLTYWTNEWLIKLNINKCKVVSYGRNVDHSYHYYINDVQLEQLDSISDLGVHFDSQLKFDIHIDEKINKAYSFLGIIKRNFTYLSTDAFITLYKSLVRPHLEYAVQVWSPYSVAYIKKIEKVQMRATKQSSIKHLSYVERLKYLRLPTLHYRRIRGDMIMLFKTVTGIIDSNVSCNFISSHSVTRGNIHKLAQKHVHYNLTKFSFTNRVVPIWNSLPNYVVSACSISVFEKRLDSFWTNQEFVYDWKADVAGIGNRSLV